MLPINNKTHLYLCGNRKKRDVTIMKKTKNVYELNSMVPIYLFSPSLNIHL